MNVCMLYACMCVCHIVRICMWLCIQLVYTLCTQWVLYVHTVCMSAMYTCTYICTCICAYCMYECNAHMYIRTCICAYCMYVRVCAYCMYECNAHMYIRTCVCAYCMYVLVHCILYKLCVPSEVNSCSCHILFLKHLED